MQDDFFPYTIDPSCLDLKARPITSTSNAKSSSAVDDIAIASGQAEYDYGGNDNLNAWSSSYHDEYGLGDFELEDLGLDSTKATEACNAPARVWAIGRGGVDSNSLSQYSGSSALGDGEPWDNLQTFASGALSAPGLDYRDSHMQQNGPPSPCPSNWLEPGFSPGSFKGSHRHHEPSPLQVRLLYDLQSPQETRITSYSSDIQHGNRRSSWTPQPNRFGQDYKDGQKQNWSEAGGSLGLSISSFPSSSTNESVILSGLMSSTTEPCAAPCRCKDGSREIEHAGKGVEHTSDFLDKSIGRGLMGESRQTFCEDPDYLTANEPSWQQQGDLSVAASGVFGSAIAGCEPPGQDCMGRKQYSTALHLYRAANQCGAHNATSERLPDCPGAIMIPGSSKRYDADLTSSFPPTAGHFPDYVPIIRTPERHQSTLSRSQPTMCFPKQARFSMRTKNSKTKPSRRSRSGSLKVIQEHDNSLGSSPTDSLRGRRKGHLDRATALAAGQKRSDGTVCIRCKMMKQTCEGDLPCEGCQKNSNARSWGQPCNKAKFMDMIEAGTCNAVFQRSASIRSIDGDQRVCLQYPGGFDLDDIIDNLRTRESRYNIGVRHFSRSSYTLDLAKLTKLVSVVQVANRTGSCELDDLSKHKTSKASGWLDCVADFDQSISALERSIKWNNMPSRNSYFYLPLNSVACHPMAVDNEKDQSSIRLAVHLCRIVLRALEVNAFRTLQKEVNDLPKNKSTDTEIASLAHNLITILFSLRWRISWWAVFGISSNIGDDVKGRYTERVSMLTQTLYFWYFVVRKRLSQRVASSSKGIWNTYADAAQAVFEMYPEDESIDGFHTWMACGRDSIHRAYVSHSVPRAYPSS